MKSVGTSITNTARRNASLTRNEIIGISRVSLTVFLTAVIACASVLLSMPVLMVYAHGDHGDAAPPAWGVSLFRLQDFQAELLTSPRPPGAGEAFLGTGSAGKALVPFIALSSLFTRINLYMLIQPMGMCHGM